MDKLHTLCVIVAACCGLVFVKAAPPSSQEDNFVALFDGAVVK